MANRLTKLRLADLFSLKILLHDRFITVSQRFQELFAIFFRLGFHISRNRLLVELGPEAFLFPNHSFHGNQIDDSNKLLIDDDGKLDNRETCAQTFLSHPNQTEETSPQI